jgi:hypothetical protein
MILRKQSKIDLEDYDIPEHAYVFEAVSIEDLIASGSINMTRKQYEDLTSDNY